MPSKLFAATMGAALLSVAAATHAGPYSDDLGKCMVNASTKDDRAEMVRWFFAALAHHPAIKSFVAIPEEQIDLANRQIGALFTKLLTTSCKSEAQKALQFEGPIAFQASFEVLGRVAGQEMLAAPEVRDSLGGLKKYLDMDKLKELQQQAAK